MMIASVTDGGEHAHQTHLFISMPESMAEGEAAEDHPVQEQAEQEGG